MSYYPQIGRDSEQDRRVRQLQQQRIQRLKEMRRIDKERHSEMMKWYRQEAKLQENDLKEYFARCNQAEKQGKLIQRVLEEQAWATGPNARHEGEIVQQRAESDALKKRQLQQIRKLSQNARAQQAMDIMSRQAAEEAMAKAAKLEKYKAFQIQEEARRKKVIDQQHFRDAQRKQYFLEQELYRDSLEHKIRQCQGAEFVEVVKERQVPLMVTRRTGGAPVQVVPEARPDANCSGVYSADAFVEAATRAQNPQRREYPEFDYKRHSEARRVDALAQEGLSILKAIALM